MHFVGDFEKALHCSDPVSLSHADGRPPRNAVAHFKYCALCLIQYEGAECLVFTFKVHSSCIVVFIYRLCIAERFV